MFYGRLVSIDDFPKNGETYLLGRELDSATQSRLTCRHIGPR